MSGWSPAAKVRLGPSVARRYAIRGSARSHGGESDGRRGRAPTRPGRAGRTGRRGRRRARTGVVVREDERQVELATLEQPEQLLVEPGLDQPNLDTRPAFHVAAHRAGQEPYPALWNVPTRSVPASPSRERMEIGLGGPHRGRSAARMAEQPLARPRSASPAGDRRAVEQARPAARSSVAICWLIADCE